jgi:Alpha-galactosidases/6-phospho-beta-glucosidases, family 4 of glycosyl hydrolases
MRQAGKTRGEVVMEVEQELLRKYADPNQVVKPPELSQRGGALYSEAAVRLILSLVLDRRDVQIVDVRNGGAIRPPRRQGGGGPLRRGGARRHPAADGAAPGDRPAPLPDGEGMGDLDGGGRSDRFPPRRADGDGHQPLVRSVDLARTLLEEMLEANREYLPQFF